MDVFPGCLEISNFRERFIFSLNLHNRYDIVSDDRQQRGN